VKGIVRLAYKLLVNDRSQFTAVLVGITFAVFLMMFITSMFTGVLNHASATVINIGASMWVMDPSMQAITRHGEFPQRTARNPS
jgi:putative ABC transport system permease protein